MLIVDDFSNQKESVGPRAVVKVVLLYHLVCKAQLLFKTADVFDQPNSETPSVVVFGVFGEDGQH
jgi:hypothetical protein